MRPVGSSITRRVGTALLACSMTAAVALHNTSPAGAAIVPTVELGAAATYSVLGGSTVTNTGPTTLNANLGLSPGTSITGFPPGIASGETHIADAQARSAQSSLTAAYVDAAGRPLNATTTADLANVTLVGGVYAGPGKDALSLSGPLVLDGEGNSNSVFIFQTNSTLTTASGSSVSLINGARACNVFWQVGSSATLGTGSDFVGTILALTSITVTTGVDVDGRALARNGAVTLDTDVFRSSTCAATPQQATTSTTAATTTSTTTSTTAPATPATPVSPSTSTVDATTGGPDATTTTVVAGGGFVTTTTVAGGTGTDLPRTGPMTQTLLVLAVLALVLGTIAVHYGRSRTTPALADRRPLA